MKKRLVIIDNPFGTAKNNSVCPGKGRRRMACLNPGNLQAEIYYR